MIPQPLRQHHLLMVPKHDGASSHLPVPVEQGVVIKVYAVYIDAYTGGQVGDTELYFTGPQELHFMESSKEKFHHYYYIVEKDSLGKTYRCSCFEGKSQGFCDQIKQLSPEFAVVA